ncbi:MAG: DUF1232 domain-containing protein [Alphaproteobacteria bacterium]|nr:DUF1232 domain-containing protein [Alphaproteobacteria bacterium]MDX5415255.1 DUF1232 domain-containing protein [Alphaproteobacteria bacterium]MDX5492464.1 DUF1232 domain-containing protein [Alphaproteobacteria bacterium]
MPISRGQPGAGDAESELLDPKHQLPAVIARNEKTVSAGFWKKLLKVAGRVPFAEEAAAAWFCARDPETPVRVRATLLAALAYFVMPADFIPDIVAAFGFTDDATVLMAALGLVSSYLKPRHRKAARAALGLPPAKDDPENG